jgi:hypothetical protein
MQQPTIGGPTRTGPSEGCEFGRARRTTLACVGAALGALALLSLVIADHASAATTETIAVPATRTIETKYDPNSNSRCATVLFARWQAVPGAIRWKVFYDWAGTPHADYIEPPFDDAYTAVGARFPPPAGYHQFAVAHGVAEHLGGRMADCSEFPANSEARFPPPNSLEIEVEVVDERPVKRPRPAPSAYGPASRHRARAFVTLSPAARR